MKRFKIPRVRMKLALSVSTALLIFSLMGFFEVEIEVNALTFFGDDFVDLENWDVVEGEWSATGGVLKGTAKGEALIWAGNKTWTNYQATANVRVVGLAGEASLVIRYADSANFYYLGLGCWGHKYSISRVIDGNYVELNYSGLSSEVETNRFYTVTVLASHNLLQLFVDGAKVLEVVDSSYLTGAIGFRTYNSTMQTGKIAVQSIIPTESPTPNYSETSEYLIGHVAVGVILLESNGTIDLSTENWTPARETQVISEIQTGLSWLANDEPNADVSFVYDLQYGVPTSYEPINRPSTDQNLWISEAMENLGYSSNLYYRTQVDNYINTLRETLGADWAFAIFVVDSFNDPDGSFTNDRVDGMGKVHAYSNFGGPFLVMTYDIGAYGINNMDYVTAHEACHIFHATDEYNGVTETRGYLGIQDLEGSGCMMEKRTWWLCTNSKQQLGWRDSDNDGLQDIVDTFPDSTLHPFFPEVTSKSVLNYSGFVSETPYPNSNPRGSGRDITINTISTVEFRVDGGAWQNAVAEDGAFDEAIEEFFFSTPNLSEGFHTIETRGVNSAGNTEPISDFDNVIVDLSPPITNINLEGSMGNNDWVLSDVTVSLSATDSISSIDTITYSFDNSAWVEYTTPFLITQEGSTIIYYKSTDSAGNVETVRTRTTKMDKTSPVGSVIINDNLNYTTSNNLTLTFSTIDTTSGVVQMCLSDDGVFDTEPWETFVPTKSWTLSAVEGLKTIYAQFKDGAGLISSTYSDDIILDQTTPSGSIIINNDENYTTSTLAILSLAYDDANGISWVRYSNDGVWDTETWETPTPTKSWTLTSGNGLKVVYYQIRDNAGLTSSAYSDTIILESPSPTPAPTPTPRPTATPTPTPTPLPTMNPQPTPTESPSPTSTPTVQPPKSPAPPSPDPPLLLYGFIAATIILLAAILAVLLWKKVM